MLLKHYLTAFERVEGEVEGGGGVDNHHSGSRWGNSARRPFSHKFLLVYFNHFETHMLDSWKIIIMGKIMISYHNALLHVCIDRVYDPN